MGSPPPLDVSPLASLLLELATQKATGRIALGGRVLELVKGALVEIAGASNDETLEELLHKNAGVSQRLLDECSEAARREGVSLSQLLARRGIVSELELRELRRTICVERLTRALRIAPDQPPQLEPAGANALSSARGLPLSPLLLDALLRAQPSADTRLIAASLNHRIEWVRGPHTEAARDWADLGEGPEQPAVSTVLAKRPAAASRLVALLRTGLIRLNPPGRTLASQSPPAEALPEPPPRLALIDNSAVSLPPEGGDPIALLQSNRPPRLRLDPGSVHLELAPLEPTVLVALPQPNITIDDPLLPLEQRIAELEANAAPGPERARAFSALADVWRDRLFSTERACRAFREAAAADPSDSNVLQQAALHCHYLGQPELALRYAAGAVHAANIAVERASAQRLRAGIERVAGHVDACIEALCEAAADDPGSPGLHEQVAALLFEHGNLDGANAHARLAAAAVEEGEHERQLTLLAWAFWLKPDDAASAYEYASLLDESGRRAGAVTILADTARRSGELEQRRKLRFSAAERALAAERPDITAELLLDAFDADPEFAGVHVRLDTSLRALEFPQLRAAVVEDIATVCSDDRRAHWLARAGEAMLDTRDQREAANWLFLEALLTEPTAAEPLTLLRANARSPRELALLAHGLRAAISVRVDDEPSKAELLHELAQLAEMRLDNVELALFAWREIARIAAEPTSESDAALERLNMQHELAHKELDLLEQALAGAAPAERAELCAKLAVLVPDMPEQRARKIELLTEALHAGAASDPLCDALETLHGLNRDASALAAFLEAQAERSVEPKERARLLSRLCAVHTVREDHEAVARVAESLLELDRGNLNAIARLLRAARKLGEPARQARALAAWSTAPNTPARASARALAQLAAQDELIGDRAEAARHAAAALAADPQAADAGLILLRHAELIEPRVAALGLQALRESCGASRALLSRQAQLAEALGDRALLGQVIERWLELLPHDAAAHRTRVLLRCEGLDAAALIEAASSALSLMPCSATLEAARKAFERLSALGASEDATRLGLRIAEEQGRRDFELARHIVGVAEDSGDPDLITAALELASAAAPAEERAGSLLVLAAHHAERKAYAAEVRALLRVLEGGERHAVALARLRELFALGGEGPRLLAVVMLMLELEDERERRRPLLLELASISAERLQDRERAEHYVRMLVAEDPSDESALREALGVLFALGDPIWAVGRCRAIAEACPDELGSRICVLAAVTAEQRLGQPQLALEIARAAALRWPAQTEPLLLVERLTLADQDASTALATYDALCAVATGPHGRRALLYRAGRWLERAGLLDQALERYEHAFELAPTTGAAFKALTRVARETGKLDRIVPCYERLAEHINEPRAQMNLLSTASELCLDELHDGRRGLQLLLRANELSERAEFDERVLSRCRGLRAREPQAAIEALERLTGQLTERATQLWNGEDKVRCLVRLASVNSQDLGRHAQALAQIDEALAIAQREGVSSALAADARNERTAVLARVSSEPSEKPTKRDAEPRGAPPKPPAAASQSEKGFVELRQLVLAEPWRTDALRELLAVSRTPAQRHVLEQLVASFDAGCAGPDDVGFQSAPPTQAELRNVLAAADAAELWAALALLWERARTIPRFRALSLRYQLNERDRISHITTGALASAHTHAARMLDRASVHVYLVANGVGIEAVPTHPPAVLVKRDLHAAPSALGYRMAHALWLAHPEHVIAGVLAPRDAADLLRAVRLGFTSDQTSELASPADKELTANLWQNLPSGEQHKLAASVRKAGAAFEYTSLRARSRASAARAALFCSGSLQTALETLPTIEPELTGIELTRETAFVRACQLSAALSETIRCALSDDYLALLERALAKR